MTSNDPDPRGALWLLLAGNFLTGTGVLLPAGMLTEIGEGLAVPPERAGMLMLAGGLVVGIGAPLLAALTWRVDRRLLLTLAMAVYAVGHAASAFAPSFEMLLALRALTVIGAAIFTPQAAATASLLVSPERRAGAIAFIFIGWSVASVAGIPLGSYIAATAGWQVAYGAMAALSLLGTLALWAGLPRGRHVAPLDLSAWKEALTRAPILLVLLTTLLLFSGQFTVFAYFAPIMKEGYGIGDELFALTLAVIGCAGIFGNMMAARLVGRLGPDRAVGAALAVLAAGLALFTAGFGIYALALVGGAIWSVGGFSANSLQQSRLVGPAPPLASATVALNTSAVYLGQAVGSAGGGLVIARGVSPAFGLVALGFVALALLASTLAARLSR